MNTSYFHRLRYFFDMRLDKGLHSYGRAVRKNPKDDELHVKIATLFLFRFQSSKSSYHWAQAVRHFQHGLKLGAFSGQCYLVLGTELEKQGDADQAHEVYSQGLSRFLEILRDNPRSREKCLDNLALVHRFLQHKASTDHHSRTLLQRIPGEVLEELRAQDEKKMDTLFIHENHDIRVEERRYPRVRTSSESDVSSSGPRGHDELQTADGVLPMDLLDLSERGIKVLLEASPRIGTSVKLMLVLAGSPVTVSGTIRWTQKPVDSKFTIMGIEISKVSQKDRLYISNHIQGLLTETT